MPISKKTMTAHATLDAVFVNSIDILIAVPLSALRR